jgi:hypothetical protein
MEFIVHILCFSLLQKYVHYTVWHLPSLAKHSEPLICPFGFEVCPPPGIDSDNTVKLPQNIIVSHLFVIQIYVQALKKSEKDQHINNSHL